MWWNITKWFNIWWYKYLLENNTGIKNIYCRAIGHRDIIFYNSDELEPDFHCKGCHEYLG